MHLPPSRKIWTLNRLWNRGRSRWRNRGNSPHRSPIKTATQDCQRSLRTGAQPLVTWILETRHHGRGKKLAWSADTLEPRNVLMCGITRENIGYPSKAGLEGAPSRGRLWGLGGRRGRRVRLHTGANCVLRLMILATPSAGPSLRAMWPGAVGLFDFTVITDIHRILRLSSSARGKSKEMLRSARVPGQI